MDGSNFELPDEAANLAAFGYPRSRTGHAGYPQAQCAVLVECATHAILGACIAVRWLLHQGTSRHKLKHAEQSFVAHLNALRVNQTQSAAFAPSEFEKKVSLI